MAQLESLLSFAVDLTASLASHDRLQRLVDAVRAAIPCDAAAVLALSGDELIPLATHGQIGELPLSVQPKLLRALQEGEIQRVGSDKPLHVNVRSVAATNRDLEQEVRAGRFSGRPISPLQHVSDSGAGAA
jgi:transcriptional regulator with GAF, ATPase, and Fis domain